MLIWERQASSFRSWD